MNSLKIFQLEIGSEMEWIAAVDKKSARKFYYSMVGEDDEDLKIWHTREIFEKDWDQHSISYPDEDRDADGNMAKKTFRELMAEISGDEPVHLGSTSY